MANAADNHITHLLVVSEDNGTVNKLISNLRYEGLPLRAASANSLHMLTSLLTQDQWDVLVCYDDAPVDLDDILQLLAKHEQDIPVLQVATAPVADARLQPLFARGVRDVVAATDENRLQLSIKREAQHYSLKKQLRRIEIKHQELEKRHQQLLEDSTTAISYVMDGMHLYCNQSYAQLFGYPDINSVQTTPLLNLIVPSQRSNLKTLLNQAALATRSETLMARKQDGTETELLLTFSPVEYHSKACLQMTAQSASGNAEYSEEIARLNTKDLLTRLDNRAYFMERIEGAIRTAVQKGIFSTLLVLEITDFDDITTAIGKSSGNIVLNDIAGHIQHSITKPFAAGRLSNHVFGIILYDGDPDVALSLANDFRQHINNRISSAMLASLELKCSIGIALINGHSLNAKDILARAELNLRELPAKNNPGGAFRINDTMRHDSGDMLAYLRLALEQNRFKLVYQPIVGISGTNHRFYEVLVRMLDNDGNEILPGAFLPLADLNGMGEDIDRMVVCMTLETLQKSDSVQHLTVNITSNTLLSLTFLPWLSEQLQVSRIQADRLVIDISEIALHNSMEKALAFCSGLHVLGVRLTISHFGCALDPFAILEHLNPEFVTLDETVVRDLIYSSQQKNNVNTIVKALHTRQLQVVAPQVEDMAVLPVLWEIGVDFVQGYCVQAPSNEMNYEFVQDEEITLTAAPQ